MLCLYTHTRHAHTFQDSSKIKLSPSKSTSENPAKKTEDSFGQSSGGAHNSLNGFDAVLIKTEPGSGGSTPACVQSPPLSGNSTTGSKAPPTSLPFPSASSSSSMSCSNGRFGRSFSTPDAKRRCPGGTNNQSSPLLEDENDLKLKPYDFLNNVIKTPPIKPLEEGDDPPITPSPTSMGPLLRRPSSNPPTNNSCTSNHSNHSNPPSTPTGNGISTNNISTSSSSSQMDEDLNEFYRVMEQVKGRLSSASVSSGNITTATISTSGATSTQIDMYGSMSPPPGVVDPGSGSAAVPPSQRIISPPPYNATLTGALPQTRPLAPGNYRGSGGQQQLQHAVLTSPPGHSAVSPPFTGPDTRSLYSRALVAQQQQSHAPPSLNMQQHQQRQQGQAYSTAVTHTSLPSSQVNLPLQFSSNHASLHTTPPHHPTAAQQAQVMGKTLESQPRTCLAPTSHHQSMLLSHLNQDIVSCPTVATPTPLTSHMYYNGSSQSPQQIRYTSAPLTLPPHPPAPPQQQQTQPTPLTPTTPLEHFSSAAAFQTSQSSRISPTHVPTSPLCHPGGGGLGSYTTFSDTPSHFLSNHVQTPCLPPTASGRGHQQTLQMPQQQIQNSGSLTISTNSWPRNGHSGRLPTQQLPNMMTAQHAAAMMSRNQVGSLPRMQVPPGQPSSLSMSSYQLNQRMSHLSSLQRHTVPAAYLQSCGSSVHPSNTAAFSGLPFP